MTTSPPPELHPSVDLSVMTTNPPYMVGQPELHPSLDLSVMTTNPPYMAGQPELHPSVDLTIMATNPPYMGFLSFSLRLFLLVPILCLKFLFKGAHISPPRLVGVFRFYFWYSSFLLLPLPTTTTYSSS